MRRGLPVESDLRKEAFSLYEGVEYEEFWTGRQKHNLDELEHVLIRKLLPASGHRIIDVGCGYGRLADCYLDRFRQVVMVDGSMSLLSKAIERTRGRATYIACDAAHLPFPRASFDAVLMIRVFHHLAEPETCLSGLKSLLCKDGRLVFSYMNKRNLSRIVRWLVGRNRINPFTRLSSGQGTTMVTYHPRTVDAMLSQAEFSDLQYFGAGVVDWLAERVDLSIPWTVLGERLAGFLGKSGIAPWIICRAVAIRNAQPVNFSTSGIDLLIQCPACGGELHRQTNSYECRVCRKRYPIADGIIDLRMK